MRHSPTGMLRRFLLKLKGYRFAMLVMKLALLGTILLAAFLFFCQWLVLRAGAGRLYTRVEDVPPTDVAVVLGAGEHLAGGSVNPFFKYRIAAASALYKAGKVRHLLVTGDNHTRGYDEPAMMKAALLREGIPEKAVSVDDAGFRTLDSIVRAGKVFGLRRYVIVSQRFHNQRALLIAGHYGMDVAGFCAADVGFRYSPWTHVREVLARVRVVLDLYVLHTRPKFLGPVIRLPV